MKCPNCQGDTRQGAFICDICNFILDSSFLQGGADVAAARPAPAPARGGVKKAAEAFQRLDELAAPDPQTMAELGGLQTSFRSMPLAQRILVGGIVVMLVSLVLPWQGNRVENGDFTVFSLLSGDAGFAVGAWPVFVLGVLAAAAFAEQLHPLLAPYVVELGAVSVGAGVLSLVFHLMYLSNAFSRRLVRSGGVTEHTFDRWASLGAFTGLLGAVLVVVGALLCFRQVLARQRRGGA